MTPDYQKIRACCLFFVGGALGDGGAPGESARILAHSKTLPRLPRAPSVASVLECGGLPPLSRKAHGRN
ncbi:MAG: hypothetical protein AVDCRST_MAG42-2573 [uncultured Chthoniobacterales bacterium]|uniref:Uncharacterized protein n=1 Tax=uncultured Chthoniobacterales bacterium TaxID=1836801 RepID=A0A6J4IRH3_9BACT|nr:MAG: hypothetical protein AVDCRST_MAG42-2573 [uncultured Chthoniobacterales bacterium]